MMQVVTAYGMDSRPGYAFEKVIKSSAGCKEGAAASGNNTAE